MEEIIRRVIQMRLNSSPDDHSRIIQLSVTMMYYFIESVNRTLVEKIRHIDLLNEVIYNDLGEKWIIRCRSYRDDTNDGDVEQAIAEFLTILNQ